MYVVLKKNEALLCHFSSSSKNFCSWAGGSGFNPARWLPFLWLIFYGPNCLNFFSPLLSLLPSLGGRNNNCVQSTVPRKLWPCTTRKQGLFTGIISKAKCSYYYISHLIGWIVFPSNHSYNAWTSWDYRRSHKIWESQHSSLSLSRETETWRALNGSMTS